VLVVCLAGGAAIASALLVDGLHSTSKAGASGSSLSANARQAAYEQGRQAGYDQGLAAAKTNKSGAYAKALAKAQRKGYKIGFAAGQDSGRRQGYSAGFQDGSGKYKAAVDAYTKLTKSLQQQAKSGKPAKP
jgi:flagellar biosynthesis/type III secretory pathway protein FliH